MKTVIIKNSRKILLLILILSSLSFTSLKLEKNKNDCFYLDVIGDSRVDTLFLKSSYLDKSNVDIVLLQNGIENKVLTIKPRLHSLGEYVTTIPQIEVIRLESNYTQSDDKELRIIIRNTDIMPDYIFIDLSYDNQWVVKRYYVCNSNIDKPVFISVIKINRPLDDELGKDKILEQEQILNLFSNEF